MKFSIFSSFLPISCTFLLSVANSAVIEHDAVTVTQKSVISGNERISQENGNVNSRNAEEIPHIPTLSSENSQNNNGNGSSTASASVATTINKTKGRRTKVLENPIDSQLISQFRELSNSSINISGISRDSTEHVREKLPPSPKLPPQQQQEISTMKLPPQQPHQPIFYGKRQRLMRRKIYSSPSRFFLKNNTKREDAIPPEGPPGSELEFPFHLSPIEGSLGGFTGLQGLEPLTPVQFIKTLVAVTPFIIPLIFIPLLIFTIGILMIPVTRANVFLDVGEIRRRGKGGGPSFDLLPSFLSNPIKTISSAVATGSVIPRSLAYEIGSKLLDTEECVERLSCEISERYLSYSNWEQGNWRSVVNRSWISRMLNLFGRKYPAVSRIAKSLLQSDHDESLLMMSVMNKERDRYLREKLRKSTSHESCHRYTCQPRTLLQKFISPARATPSPSSSLVSFPAPPASVNKEEAKKLPSKSENEQESVNL